MEFEMTDEKFYELTEHSDFESGDMFIERISPDSHKHEVSFALWLLIIENPERVQLMLLGKTKSKMNEWSLEQNFSIRENYSLGPDATVF